MVFRIQKSFRTRLNGHILFWEDADQFVYTFEHLKRRPNLIKKIDLQFNNYIIT